MDFILRELISGGLWLSGHKTKVSYTEDYTTKMSTEIVNI